MINVKPDMEYIVSTGHTIADDGTIPINIKSELVRCRDCKYVGFCKIGNLEEMGFYGYCSKGKRREETEHD